jgi:hypothetical protein
MPAYAGCDVSINLAEELRGCLSEYSLCVYELHKAASGPLFSSALTKCRKARGRYVELKEAIREHEKTHHCSGLSVSEYSLPK